MQERLRDQLDRHPGAVAGSVVGGALVLLALAVGLATGVFGPRPTGDASPVPSASANPPASPSSTAPAPSATPPDDDLLLQVMVDGLRMRATASISADIVRSLDRGEVVRVVSGLVDAEGYAWYEVVDLDSQSGWAATGDGGAPWLEVAPADPATSELLLRFSRACDATPPFYDLLLPLTVTADGRVLLGGGLVRQLGPSGLAQVQRDVLESPFLQASAEYRPEPRPGAPEAPGHGACLNTFTLGQEMGKVVVAAINWQGDEEEAAYFVPSPERHALDELALHLSGLEQWLGPEGWADPVARRYIGGSYLLTLSDRYLLLPEVASSVSDAAWPFDGPIEEFGCGYLSPGQAFETLRLMGELAVRTQVLDVGPPRQLALDGLVNGAIGTDAGTLGFYVTPRTPDGYPSCADVGFG